MEEEHMLICHPDPVLAERLCARPEFSGRFYHLLPRVGPLEDFFSGVFVVDLPGPDEWVRSDGEGPWYVPRTPESCPAPSVIHGGNLFLPEDLERRFSRWARDLPAAAMMRWCREIVSESNASVAFYRRYAHKGDFNDAAWILHGRKRFQVAPGITFESPEVAEEFVGYVSTELSEGHGWLLWGNERRQSSRVRCSAGSRLDLFFDMDTLRTQGGLSSYDLYPPDFNARLAQLRDCMHGPRTHWAWMRVCRLLERWPPQQGFDAGLQYAMSHIEGWPKALLSKPEYWEYSSLLNVPVLRRAFADTMAQVA